MTHYTSENPAHLGTRVFLNGSEVEDVTECDPEAGWLIRIVRDADGKLQADERRQAVLTERIEGAVSVIPPAR